MKLETICRIAGVGFLILLLVWKWFTFTVDEGFVALRARLGELDEQTFGPGLHFSLPGVDRIHTIDRRVQPWDGESVTMPTADKSYLVVDTFGRWRVADPALFYRRTRGDKRRALSRIEDVLGSEVREAVAGAQLAEVIRSDPDRVPQLPEEARELGIRESFARIPEDSGRRNLERIVLEGASEQLLDDLGVELLSFAFKRSNYTAEVERNVAQRMISERQRIAARFVSEGEREAERIRGSISERERTVLANARREAREVVAEARGNAASIYSETYGGTEDRASFFSFYQRMDLYPRLLEGSRIVLPGDSEALEAFASSGAQEVGEDSAP